MPIIPQNHLSISAPNLPRFFGMVKPETPPTTNQGAEDIAFQRWFHFKEAFSPTFVRDVLTSLPSAPRNCLDPFAGSGTTALTCQFLGVEPTSIELNPFLADLIEAKLTVYDIDRLIADRMLLAKTVNFMAPDVRGLYRDAPPTLCEPGHKGRWVFAEKILYRIAQYRLALEQLNDKAHARLFRVLLGSTLVDLSNVVVNGKGRRYRGGWERLVRVPFMVDAAFEQAYLRARSDLCRLATRLFPGYRIVRGDAREKLSEFDHEYDLALFSPPYLNSFDYTDIYNLQLWVLGYLSTRADNAELRLATVQSHVQILRDYSDPPTGSPKLSTALEALKERRTLLWNRSIPSMVGAYFHDISRVLHGISRVLAAEGKVVMVVGDSGYGDVVVPVAAILAELAPSLGLEVERLVRQRPLRASAQQGGDHVLSEHLVFLRRPI